MHDEEMLAMLVEHMGKGFLENIIALFKQDPSLMKFIPRMLADERLVVRLGTTALAEELAGGHRLQLREAVPGLIGLLHHGNPTIRGDAANVLGILKDSAAREALRRLLDDENAAVREIAAEALKELE